MVVGLNIFKKYFEAHANSYVIIGGTACDIILSEAGFRPRATRDIDIILIVEALNAGFVKKFWQFIQDGKYEQKEKSTGERTYYRFMKPQDSDFPYQIELFARKPDVIDLGEQAYLTPIPVGSDLSSLSAILLNDDYYNYMIEHSFLEDGIRRANTEALICLKAKAYLEIKERIANGGKEDAKHVRKHKGDIFRLAVTLAPNDAFELPPLLFEHMQIFIKDIANDLPDVAILKEMGEGNIPVEVIYEQLQFSFQLIKNK